MTSAVPSDPLPASSPKVADPPKIVLKSSEFRKGREESWRDLEGLVGRVERRGVRSLSVDELQRLPMLYRSALSSLSVARTIALDRNLLLYLENLALRAFLAVYGPRVGLWEAGGEFFRRGWPAAVRAVRWHVLLAFGCMVAGLMVGFMLTVREESWFSAIAPAGLGGGRGPSSTRADLEKVIFAPWPGFAESLGVFANYLFGHNTIVSIMTFGLGMAAGIPTILLLAYNGLVIGTFIGLHYNRGLTVEFLGWLSIHGTTELSAVILCGAGGLVIADKLLFPGRYSRVENLALHGRMVGQVAVGAVVMLFVAAILEGVFRQLVQSTTLRFTIGIGIGLLWLVYFLHGRKPVQR